MVTVLRELTLPDMDFGSDDDCDGDDDDDDDDDEEESEALRREMAALTGAMDDLEMSLRTPSKGGAGAVGYITLGRDRDSEEVDVEDELEGEGYLPRSSAANANAIAKDKDRVRDSDSKQSRSSSQSKKSPGGGGGDDEKRVAPLLHSGPLLGDLPSLGGSGRKVSPEGKKAGMGLHNVLQSNGVSDGTFASLSPSQREQLLTRKRNTKGGKGKGKGKGKSPFQQVRDPTAAGSGNVPPHFICQLSQKFMTDPVMTTTTKGHVYERNAILSWFQQQGHVCPLTGMPLTEADLVPQPALKEQIRQYLERRANGGSGEAELEPEPPLVASAKNDRDKGIAGASAVIGGLSPQHGSGQGHGAKAYSSPSQPPTDDDLYDF